MDKPETFDNRVCLLGEGALWHPLRRELFWVDIKNQRLHSRRGNTAKTFALEQTSSALGWIDETTLLIANVTGLISFDLNTEETTSLCAIEADNSATRSNDGRADPWGGFWISTMNNDESLPPAGNIYRWYTGELRLIAKDLSVPNGICFDHARSVAYHTDSPTSIMWKHKLDTKTGWPVGNSEIFMDHSQAGLIMDGAVTDAEGCLWAAIWDGACVMKFSPAGEKMDILDIAATRPTCPAFGGDNMSDLYVTTAAVGLDRALHPNGATMVIKGAGTGLEAPRVSISAGL